MPICLNCGYKISFYTDNFDEHFIEECWCGGYVIDRDLISSIVKKNKSLYRTLTLIKLNNKLSYGEEQQMLTYATCQALKNDPEIMKFVRDRGNDFLYKITSFVLKHNFLYESKFLKPKNFPDKKKK